MVERNAQGRAEKRAQLLHALRRNPGTSRAQLARELGVSIGTVRLLTEQLTAAGVLTESGVNLRTGGRPSARLAVNGGRGVVLGVDLGEVEMRLASFDLAGVGVEERHVEFRRRGGVVDLDHVVAEIVGMAREAGGRLLGIGLAVPGQLDLHAGDVIWSANLGWRHVPLRARLAAELNVPVIMERNSTAGMLAELWWGDHADHDVSVYVTMGSGVGASIRYGDEVFRGESGMAGELGHVVVDPQGPLCRCGRNGCLETFASIRAIQARYDGLRGLTESPGDLLDALGRGDAVALDAVREAAWYFGSALTSLINLLNPGLIILSGQLMAGTAHLVDSLEQAVRHRALPHSARPLQVVASTLGPDGMLRGAATLVLDAVYRGELLEEVSA